MIHPRADVVGSLLRPSELLDARRDWARGRIDLPEFKRIEDRAVDEAVALQEEAGLEVVTDGEMRRLSFQSQLVEAVDGFGGVELDTFLWGEWFDDGPSGDRSVPRPAGLEVTSVLRQRRFLSVDEFTYLKARTSRTPKITLPSPGLFAEFWSEDRSAPAYPTQERFLADVVAILRREVAELARLGASYIQIDAPQYGLLVDADSRARYFGDADWDTTGWLEREIELDNAVMDGFSSVTFGLHL